MQHGFAQKTTTPFTLPSPPWHLKQTKLMFVRPMQRRVYVILQFIIAWHNDAMLKNFQKSVTLPAIIFNFWSILLILFLISDSKCFEDTYFIAIALKQENVVTSHTFLMFNLKVILKSEDGRGIVNYTRENGISEVLIWRSGELQGKQKMMKYLN